MGVVFPDLPGDLRGDELAALAAALDLDKDVTCGANDALSVVVGTVSFPSLLALTVGDCPWNSDSDDDCDDKVLCADGVTDVNDNDVVVVLIEDVPAVLNCCRLFWRCRISRKGLLN